MTALGRTLAAPGVLLIVASAGPAWGQSLDALLSQIQGSGPATVVDDAAAAEAVETARNALEHAAQRRVRDILEQHPDASEELEGRLRTLATRTGEAFASEAREELLDAKGDGLLTRSELAEELTEAREEMLDSLQEQLEAAVVGADPPPAPEEFPGLLAYSHSMTRYVLLERNPPLRWAILVAWVLGAIVLVRVGSAALRRLAEHDSVSIWTRGTFSMLRGPLTLVGVALGIAAGSSWIWLPTASEEALATAVVLLAGAGLAWLWWRLSLPLGRGSARLLVDGSSGALEEAADVARKVLRGVGLGAIALVIARLAFEADLTAVLAALGIFGIGASVAAQDTLRNLIASVTIHSDRPLSPGDLVRFQGHLGHVEEVGFRSTRLRSLDGPLVVIPNAELVRERVENLSLRRHLRHHAAIDLVYGTSAEEISRAIEILEEIFSERDLHEEHGSHVIFQGFAPYSLRIEVWYTSDTGDYFEALGERSEVNLEILRRFGEAGLELAFPTHTLHLESLPGDAGQERPDTEASEEAAGDESR